RSAAMVRMRRCPSPSDVVVRRVVAAAACVVPARQPEPQVGLRGPRMLPMNPTGIGTARFHPAAVPAAARRAGTTAASHDRPGSRAALFGLVFCVLLFAAWPSIRHANVEIGDFAGNTLLVQDAKHLRLWTG